MDRFSKFHPIVGFSFFVGAIILTLVFNHPTYLLASFFASFFYLLRLIGKGIFKKLFCFILPLIAAIGVFNMIFSSRGETVLLSLGNYAFTLEALLYGLNTGLSLACVIMWFDGYNAVITSEKFMSLFGKIAPRLALLFCMVLRFIPLMEKTAREIKEAQIGLGAEVKGVKNAVSRFSALISICLERSIETANSMEARGYSTKRRTAYSRFTFRLPDAFAMIFIVAAFAGLIIFKAFSAAQLNIVSLIFYSIFLLFPMISDFMEDAKWLCLKSKI